MSVHQLHSSCIGLLEGLSLLTLNILIVLALSLIVSCPFNNIFFADELVFYCKNGIFFIMEASKHIFLTQCPGLYRLLCCRTCGGHVYEHLIMTYYIKIQYFDRNSRQVSNDHNFDGQISQLVNSKTNQTCYRN